MNVTSYQHRPTFSPQPLRQGSSLRFEGSGATAASKAAEVAAQEIKPTALIKFFLWLDRVTSKKSGEVVNIIVNAIGTGIVAPLVIALNKFNDEDKNTKVYSALRQPISAALAVITQVGINAPVPKILKTLSQRGDLGLHYLGQINELPDNLSPTERKHMEDSLRAKYEEAMKDTEYREKVAKTINISRKDKYENDLRLAKKGRAAHPPEFRLKSAAEMTLEDAMKYTGKRFNNFKQIIGLSLSLLTLYPTCAFLNWIYPRLMDKFFPQLTKNDK